MAFIWLESCPCLCDDNHGVAANNSHVAVAKSEAVGQHRSSVAGRSAARATTIDGNQRQREIKGPEPAYKRCKAASKDNGCGQVGRNKARRVCDKAHSLSVGGSLAVGDLAQSDRADLA